MTNRLFRQKAIDRLSSPEELNDYLRVTTPAVWALLFSVILLLAGTLVWGSMTYVASSVQGTARVTGGTMMVTFAEEEFTENVESGLYVTVGTSKSPIVSVGMGEDGKPFALANTDLSDGIYPATVTYRMTRIIKFLFN